MRPAFPEVVDSTIMAAAKSCPRKAELEFFQHWRRRDPNVHLHAGGAYARGLEVARRAFYEEGLDSASAVARGLEALLEAYGDFECPADSAKSLNRTAGALEFYFERYPLETDRAQPLILPSGKRAIEFGGVEPLEILHPVSGQPLLYSWRMDMAVERDGMLLGEDDKTTSQLGASWPKQWDLRSQFTGYCWGAGLHDIELGGFLIRGVSILKTKYDTLEAITYRPPWQIERWYEQLHIALERLIKMWQSGQFDYNLDTACTEYGGCTFRDACLMQDPAPLLELHFERRRWDPVTRTETLVDADGTPLEAAVNV